MKYDDNIDASHQDAVSRQDLYSYLIDTIRKLHKVLFGCSFLSQGNSNLLRLLLQDLRQISALCDETRGLCLWLRDLGQLTMRTQQMPMELNRLQEGRYLAHKMIHAYTGLKLADVECLQGFIDNIDKKIKCIQEQNVIPTRETKEILSTSPPLEDLKSLPILSCIDKINSFELACLLLSNLTQVTAKQLHPTPYDTERSANKFCAGMSVSLSVRAEFYGLDATVDQHGNIDVKTPVAVVVNRPDGMSLYWQPPDHCWSAAKHNESPNSSSSSSGAGGGGDGGGGRVFFLDTDVQLSFCEWSEPGLVYLGLVVLLPDKGLVWKLSEPVGVKVYPISANRTL